jgi:hypothetical protein
MKTFLAILTAFLLSSTAYAGTGFFYNPDRDGEGIIVTVDDKNRIAWAMFTYWDKVIPVAPIPSPAPPQPVFIIEECDRNSQAWVVGNGIYIDDAAIGDAYISRPIDYPFVSEGSLDEKIKIGTFLIEGYDGGFNLAINCNELLPPSLYMCKNVFTFEEALIGN